MKNILKQKIFILSAFIFLLSTQMAFAQDNNSGKKWTTFVEQKYAACFKPIENFSVIHTVLEGDAEKIISEDAIKNYVLLECKTKIPGIPYAPSKIFERTPNGTLKDPEKKGQIFVRVWTVGSDDPIAYYIKVRVSTFTDNNIWERDYLGYGSKDTVPNEINVQLDKLIEKFASDFYKYRE